MTVRTVFSQNRHYVLFCETICWLRPLLTGFDDLQNKSSVRFFSTVCKIHALRANRFTKQKTSCTIYEYVDPV